MNVVRGIGIAITNVTSKTGIVSRKTAMRLATNTGKAIADKQKTVGRMINKEEMEQIFTETLPKRCRPKLITTDEEAVTALIKTGNTEKEINEIMQMPFAAAVISGGTKKYPMWIPFSRLESFPKEIQDMASSITAHELEHSLEKNNRIVDIFRRKISGIKESICKIFDKNYKTRVHNREMEIHKIEEQIQYKMGDFIDRKTGQMLCKPSVESIEEYLKQNNGKGFKERMQEYIRRNYANPENSGSEQIRRLDKINYWLDMERPAYEVSAEVDRYIFGLQEGENFVTEYIPKCYEATIDVVKKDRRSYFKNLLCGKLKKPNVYATDEDLLKHATTQQDKQILQELIKGLKKEQKDHLIQVLYSFDGQPEAIKLLKSFLNKTTVKGKNIYLDHLDMFEGINSKLLINPDFISIAKIGNSKVENANAVMDLLYELAKSNKTNSKLLRIYAGKLQKTIQHKGDIRNVVNQFFREKLKGHIYNGDKPKLNLLSLTQ